MRFPAISFPALAMMAVTLFTAAAAVAQTGAAPSQATRDSPAVRTLMETEVGAQPHADLHWPQVLEALGLKEDAALLRGPLLENWLLEATGSPLPPLQPIAQLLASTDRSSGTGLDAAAQARWAMAFGQHLQVRLPAAAVPLPEELQTQRAQVVETAPGMWVLNERNGTVRRLFAAVELVNTWALPFPTAEFELRAARTPRSPVLVLRCLPPYGSQARALPSGAATLFVCRLKDAASDSLDLAQVGQWFPQAASQGVWQHRPAVLATESQRSQIVRMLADLPKPQTYAWLNTHAMTCVQRGNCPPQTVQPAARPADAPMDAPRPTVWQRLANFGWLAAGAAVYLVVARWLGPWVASVALAVIGLAVTAPVALSLLRQNTADLWGGIFLIPMAAALVGVPVLVAVVAAVAYTTVVRLIADARYRASFIWGVAVVLMLVALELVLTL